MDKQALGLIETYGYVGAVMAADVCLKAANVSLINCEMTGGGLVSIKICGDVGAVKASIESAEIAVKKMRCLVSAHVIPRPAEELKQIIYMGDQQRANINISEVQIKEVLQETIEVQISIDEAGLPEGEIIADEVTTDEIIVNEVITNESESMETDFKVIEMPKEARELMGMRVVDLRILARQLEGIPLDKNEIRFARKDELVKTIMTYKERGDA